MVSGAWALQVAVGSGSGFQQNSLQSSPNEHNSLRCDMLETIKDYVYIKIPLKVKHYGDVTWSNKQVKLNLKLKSPITKICCENFELYINVEMVKKRKSTSM